MEPGRPPVEFGEAPVESGEAPVNKASSKHRLQVSCLAPVLHASETSGHLSGPSDLVWLQWPLSGSEPGSHVRALYICLVLGTNGICLLFW